MRFPLVRRSIYEALLLERYTLLGETDDAIEELYRLKKELRKARAEADCYKKQWARVLLDNTILAGSK